MSRLVAGYVRFFAVIVNGVFRGVYSEDFDVDAVYACLVDIDDPGVSDFEGEIPPGIEAVEVFPVKAYDLSRCDFQHGIEIYVKDEDENEHLVIDWKRREEFPQDQVEEHVGPFDKVYIPFMTCDDYRRNELILRNYMNVK